MLWDECLQCLPSAFLAVGPWELSLGFLWMGGFLGFFSFGTWRSFSEVALGDIESLMAKQTPGENILPVSVGHGMGSLWSESSGPRWNCEASINWQVSMKVNIFSRATDALFFCWGQFGVGPVRLRLAFLHYFHGCILESKPVRESIHISYLAISQNKRRTACLSSFLSFRWILRTARARCHSISLWRKRVRTFETSTKCLQKEGKSFSVHVVAFLSPHFGIGKQFSTEQGRIFLLCGKASALQKF